MLQTESELHIPIELGGRIESLGSADALALRQQLVAGMSASLLLEGRLVVITDWLPGLHWRIQVSQQFADLLPGIAMDAIWQAIEPRLAQWLEGPADASVFHLAPQWGHCMLVPSTYKFDSLPAEFTIACRWSAALAHRGRGTALFN